MLKDCLKVFEKVIEKCGGDKLILDSYVLDSGTYIIVSRKDGIYKMNDPINIKLDKKTKEIDRSNNHYEDLCNYDYYSKLVSTDKPIDSKKTIQSNNYLSFSINKQSLTNGKLCDERIEEYYNKLENPYLKYKSGNSKKIYESVEDELGKPDLERIKEFKNWMQKNIFNLDITGKDYLKIFFEAPIEEYKNECNRYLIPNIYNKNDFNIKIGKEIYGLPNDNMGLNSKKPYLENKTRKVTVPYLLNNSEVLLQKKFFDYLMNFATIGRVNIYIDTDNNKIKSYENGDMPKEKFSGIFLRIKKGLELEILDYDIVTSYKSNLKKKFNYKNILDIDQTLENVDVEKYREVGTRKEMEEILNKIFFSKYLVNNYFTEPGDISTNDRTLKNNLILCRNVLFNYIYKGVDNGVFTVLNKVSLNLIKGSINNGYIQKSSKQYNLRWSLINYFKGGRDMADVIHSVRDSLRVKINESENYELDNDDEYYFAVGQLVSYLLSKSKASKKPCSLANPFINGKSNDDIKEKLRRLCSKYNYALDYQKEKRFKNLYVMIIGYVPKNKKVNQDLIVGGYLSKRVYFMKAIRGKKYMDKRVYGIIGISSIMANWNADFTGNPKTTSDGSVFGSDKALKYPTKKMWDNNGEKVLYIKSMKLSEEKKGEVSLVPRALKERYEQIFDVPNLKDCKDSKEVLTNLFSAIDVKNFGATFAEAGNNISITGAVQIGQGFNKYEGTSTEEQQILSPFRDASKDGNNSKAKKKNDEDEGGEAKNSTLGTKIVSNEAHYFYPFTINPLAYKEFVELGVTDGYTEEDYEKFKNTSLVSATAFATNSKIGCENEFGLFIETEETLYLPNLSQYIEFTKGEDKNVITIKCSELINKVSGKIKNIEIYYNPYTTVIESDVKGAKTYNILTKEEV